MSWLDGVGHRMRTLLRPGRYTAELNEEIEHHLDLDTMHEGDRRRATRRFGNRLAHREEARAMTWIRVFDVIHQDLRTAWRGLARTPALAALVVVTLALGVGANVATFALLDRLYFRPPSGVADPGSLRRFWVEQHYANGGAYTRPWMTWPRHQALARATDNAGQVALYSGMDTPRLGRGFDSPRVNVVYASATYFPVLGVRLTMGRFYTADEDSLGRGAPVAVVSHAFWNKYLNGDPDALGSLIPLGSNDYTVIGVLDPSFRGLDLQPTDLWIPTASAPFGPEWWTYLWNGPGFRAVERGGLPTTIVEERTTTMLRAFSQERAPGRPDSLLKVYTGSIIEARGPAEPGQELLITTRLAGVAAIVLLIAWANVINLLLARAVDRRREIAVRLALGISRARLIRTLMVETGLLALCAAAAATLMGWAGGTALRRLLMPEIVWDQSALDWRVALFTGMVALLSGLVAGFVPAIQASRPMLASALKSGGRDGNRHRSRLRAGLVMVQAALSVMLLVGAALFVQSLRNVRALDIGFEADRLIFGRLEFLEGETPPAPVVIAAMRDAAARLASRPGVEAVARVGMEPMRGFGWETFFADDVSSESLRAESMRIGRDISPFRVIATPDYFKATGLRLLHGRTMGGGDTDNAPAEVVINEAMSRLVWPGRDPIGRCMHFDRRDNPCYTVVGVVEDARWDQVIEPETRAQYYVPLGNLPGPGSTGRILIVRAEPGLVPQVSTEVRAVLAEAFPAANVTTRPMLENLEPQYRPWRLGATLFVAFGFLALLVAVVGIYSTVSYGVSQRTHEFGVRAALGAQLHDVVHLVVGEGLRTVTLGVIAGVGLALVAGRLITSMLYGIEPGNPVVLILVAICLLGVAAFAAVMPAWRAGRVDPMTALRTE
jgi:predicted permease